MKTTDSARGAKMRLILPQLADRCRRSGRQEGRATGFVDNRNTNGAGMSTIRAPSELLTRPYEVGISGLDCKRRCSADLVKFPTNAENSITRRRKIDRTVEPASGVLGDGADLVVASLVGESTLPRTSRRFAGPS